LRAALASSSVLDRSDWSWGGSGAAEEEVDRDVDGIKSVG